MQEQQLADKARVEADKDCLNKRIKTTIEKITTATGIKKVVETVAKATGKDCGCKQRRDTLNRVFPYQDKK